MRCIFCGWIAGWQKDSKIRTRCTRRSSVSHRAAVRHVGVYFRGISVASRIFDVHRRLRSSELSYSESHFRQMSFDFPVSFFLSPFEIWQANLSMVAQFFNVSPRTSHHVFFRDVDRKKIDRTAFRKGRLSDLSRDTWSADNEMVDYRNKDERSSSKLTPNFSHGFRSKIFNATIFFFYLPFATSFLMFVSLSETGASLTDENCFTETVQNQCSVKKHSYTLTFPILTLKLRDRWTIRILFE